MTKILGAAAYITDGLGRVLLVKHTYGMLNWELPGGRAEANETTSETAIREVWEETGLRVEAVRMTGLYYDPGNDSHHFVFVCRQLEDGEAQPDAQEISECGYFPVDALPRPISNFTLRRVHDAVEGAEVRLPVINPPREWFLESEEDG